jgi:endonuclease/exonuclease/phosphatase family metal-dependent hydrolase
MPRHRRRLLALGCVLLFAIAVPLSLPASAERTRSQPTVVQRMGPAQQEQPRTTTLMGPPAGDELEVMSFNLRFAAEEGPHAWRLRRPVMADLLRREQPSLIGTQEGLYGQLRDIAADLPDHYDWIGEGRKGGSRDEFVAIFFDTNRLEPVAYDHFWLSDTPNVVGSDTWGNDSVRMVTWVRFHDKLTGRDFVDLNTHLDDESGYSRERAAALIHDRVATVPASLPVIVTGDFNQPAEHSRPYEILTRNSGLTDTWLTAAKHLTPAYRTWHAYRPLVRADERIDWVLTRGAVTVDAVGLNTFARGGEFPSDHLPLQVLLRLR